MTQSKGFGLTHLKGFTLIELAVALVVFALLAAYAIPTYNQYVIRAKLSAGTEELVAKRSLMEQFYQQNHTYRTGTACGVPDDDTREYFSLTCTSGSATTYAWTATSKSTLEGVGNYVYTVNQAGVKDTSAFAGHSVTLDPPKWKFK